MKKLLIIISLALLISCETEQQKPDWWYYTLRWHDNKEVYLEIIEKQLILSDNFSLEITPYYGNIWVNGDKLYLHGGRTVDLSNYRATCDIYFDIYILDVHLNTQRVINIDLDIKKPTE
jgi:hypothetical protein